MTTGRINQVSTSARAPRPAGAGRECGWVSASSGKNRELTTPTRGRRPNFGLDHSSPSDTAPADEVRKTNSTEAPPLSEHGSEDSRASTPATVGDVPPDTHTSSLSMARAGETDDRHGETPRTRRTARHVRTRPAPRPRGKRQWKPESRALGLVPHRCAGSAGPRAPSVQPGRRHDKNHSPIFPEPPVFQLCATRRFIAKPKPAAGRI